MVRTVEAAIRPIEADSLDSMSMPILAYGFLGVEIVAVTAFEAQDRETLRDPSRFIAWFMSATYFFCALPGAIVVSWTDPDLQRLVPEPETSDKRSLPGDGDTFDECQKFYPLIVVAALQYSSKALAGYFNACIVYFCLSAANTSLYVASRTLYGLMREETQYVSSGSIVQKLLQSPRVLGRISPRTGVPVWALVVSAASFAWLPVLRAANDGSGTDVCFAHEIPSLFQSPSHQASLDSPKRNDNNWICGRSPRLGGAVPRLHQVLLMASKIPAHHSQPLR